MKASLTQLQTWVSGSRVIGEASFDGVSTDSRHVGAGNLFVALRGDNFDAHHFLSDVLAKGVAAVIAEDIPEGFSLPALLVPDSRVALGEMARAWRQQWAIPVIGVTGSNGKTTVKEMIASIMSVAFGDGGYLATRGNLNNEIGVPLTLFELDKAHQAVVIELGMNHVGEIAYLSSISKPTVGLVNNAQREHQEFMQSVAAVAEENGTVIRSLPLDGVAVFPADDSFSSLWRDYAGESGQRQVITFALDADADVTGHYQVLDGNGELSIKMDGQQWVSKLSALGIHNARNALAAVACCHAIGIDKEAIARGLENFMPVKGRMEYKKAANDAALIDDTYNANPDSVLAAIDVLAGMTSPRILVLGDMGEVGTQGQHFHEEIGIYAQKQGIEYFYTMGSLSGYASAAFGRGARHFDELNKLMQALGAVLTPEATVLVKGSRFMKMERVVDGLINEISMERN